MNIETKRLVMRAPEKEDAPFLADLVNDAEVRANLGAYNLIFPTSIELEERWISDSEKKNDEFHVLMTAKKGGKALGLIGVREINERNASAHLTIMVATESRDRGYGTEAILGMLEFLFMKLNMHRVWLRADEKNERAIRCYEKCGFKTEGKLREDHFAHGGWCCSFIMSVLVNDFKRGRR